MCSNFLVSVENTIFGQILSKRPHSFKFAEFDGDVHFHCLDWKYPFLKQIWSANQKFTVPAEIWYLA